VRLIDSCITQLKAQGPSRTCDESEEEEEACRGAFLVWSEGELHRTVQRFRDGLVFKAHRLCVSLNESERGSERESESERGREGERERARARGRERERARARASKREREKTSAV